MFGVYCVSLFLSFLGSSGFNATPVVSNGLMLWWLIGLVEFYWDYIRVGEGVFNKFLIGWEN